MKEKQVAHWKTVVKLQEKLKTVLNKVKSSVVFHVVVE